MQKLQNVSAGVLAREYVNWLKDHANQRFGQYMCNKYLPEGAAWPELFYCEDQNQALQMIAESLNG